MRFVRVRTSPLGAPALFRRAWLIARTGRLALAMDDGPGHFLIHAPTGLRCHHALENLTRKEGLTALRLLASVGDWDWRDPWAVVEMPLEQNRSLLDFCQAVGEMVRS